MIKVVVIGSGNVAYQMAKHCLANNQIELLAIAARNRSVLTSDFPKSNSVNIENIPLNADLYIIAIADNAIIDVSEVLKNASGLVVHTSGSTPMHTLKNNTKHGVLYPLQTLSKNKPIDFTTVPFCIEANTQQETDFLLNFAALFSKKVYKIDSEQRKKLHLSAVFVCNFVNHLYAIGADLCEQNKVPFEVLLPLITETAEKVQHISPKKAQTGPALRNDTNTINTHLEQLQSEMYKDIYQLITKSIQNGTEL
jgi:predicted short-subunit dehydrogenase-like oxidoreductase (DUF2520 family)